MRQSVIAFFLSLFLLQQTQVSAEFLSNNEEASQVDLIRASTLPTQLHITVAHLDDQNKPIYQNGKMVKCYYTDPAYGCGEGGSGYPYTQNPLWIDVESNYLLNVLPREMDVAKDDPTVEALKAQAVAARSYAAYRIPTDNSVNFQIYIPNSYELYDLPSSGLIYDAVMSTQGQYLAQGGSVIDAQFASDSIGRTATCINADGTQCHPYLIKVEDPISAQGLGNSACDAKNNGNSSTPGDDLGKVWGMSQKGATRWSLGNHCTTFDGNEPWPVKWDDYRQILVHYYTGIDILNASGGKVAPDDRWNLLKYETPSGATVNVGAAFDVNLTLQNTSTSNWLDNDIILGYQWMAPGVPAVPQGWSQLTYLPATTMGDPPTSLALSISAPSTGGAYTLHLDLKYQTGDWFSNGGWPDAEISPIQVIASTPTPTPTSLACNNVASVKVSKLTAPVNFLCQRYSWTYERDWTSPYSSDFEHGGLGTHYLTIHLTGHNICNDPNEASFYVAVNSISGTHPVYETVQWTVASGTCMSFTHDGYRTYNVSTPTLPQRYGCLVPGHTAIDVYATVRWSAYDACLYEAIPTPTGSPAATSTATVAPTLTPTPTCPCAFLCGRGRTASLVQPVISSVSTPSLSLHAAQLADLTEFAPLLFRVRDELLAQTPEGRRYAALYQAHSAEIAAILLGDSALYDQGYDALKSFEPGLQALLDGTGDTVTITADQVADAQAFLDALSAQASPALQEDIQTERARRSLDAMIGLTLDHAWAYLNGYTLTWLPPLTTADPYRAETGRTIPVEFTINDFQANFVIDQSVTLGLLDVHGDTVVGPIRIGNDPTQGITIQGRKYHYNLRTTGLADGLYTLRVSYNSTDPDQTSVYAIQLSSGKK